MRKLWFFSFKKFILHANIVLIILFPAIAQAWNYTGHVVIAQIAYNNLTPSVKTKVDTYAAAIFTQLPAEQKQKLEQRYPNASQFAQLALLPDTFRNWQLGTVANKYNAPLPLNFIVLKNQKTASWHYFDGIYPARPNCQLTDHNSNVIWAIQRVETGLTTTTNTNTKGLMLVLLAHYVGDAHQPLHTFSYTSNQCINDKGGNLYCLHTSHSGKCSSNLHGLWDSGLGLFKSKTNVQKLAFKIEQAEPKSILNHQIVELNPTQWILENYQYASFIYNTPKGLKPSPYYYAQGQQIVKKQVALAGYRLASILNQLLG